ncbi:MAG: endo-1,4-beta-xylanase [Chloroflexi bacterium]|nr:MAG: endo-1,4-beta-xylanase [Chloroflexota bacterium]
MARFSTLAAAVTMGLALIACQPIPAAPPTPPAQAAPPVVASPSPAMLTAAQIGVADPAVTTSLWGNAATTNRDLELARNAGFKWIKQQFEWRNIEPDATGRLQWAEADRIVDAVTAVGFKMIARVDDQPKWASTKVTFPAVGPPDKPQDFADFLTAVAARYKGRIQAYEVWDEPNVASRWGEKRPDPGEYTRMLRAAYTGIKGADPQAVVVSAALLPTTRYDETVVPDLIYLRSMYGSNVKGAFDVLGVDARGYKAAPCMDPLQVAEDPALSNNDQTLPVEGRRVYAFRHVEDVRRAGPGDLPRRRLPVCARAMDALDRVHDRRLPGRPQLDAAARRILDGHHHPPGRAPPCLHGAQSALRSLSERLPLPLGEGWACLVERSGARGEGALRRSRWALVEQPVIDDPGGDLGARIETQLAQDPTHGDDQGFRDLAVRHTAQELRSDLAFPRGQPGKGALWWQRRVRRYSGVQIRTSRTI